MAEEEAMAVAVMDVAWLWKRCEGDDAQTHPFGYEGKD
jgi:hypothetical protein